MASAADSTMNRRRWAILSLISATGAVMGTMAFFGAQPTSSDSIISFDMGCIKNQLHALSGGITAANCEVNGNSLGKAMTKALADKYAVSKTLEMLRNPEATRYLDSMMSNSMFFGQVSQLAMMNLKGSVGEGSLMAQVTEELRQPENEDALENLMMQPSFKEVAGRLEERMQERSSKKPLLAQKAFVAASSGMHASVSKPVKNGIGQSAPVMGMRDEKLARRELATRVAAAWGLAGLATAESASAKAGQFGKISIFDIVGEPGISSPYQAGGPSTKKGETTFGYKKSEGDILATGYENDVSREKAAFGVSEKIVRDQGKNIESKTWWLVQDNFRGQAYTMKANMRAINFVSSDPKKSKKAQDTFWSKVDDIDLACRNKDLTAAKAAYSNALNALDKWKEISL